jgi:ABC-2 type transport system permease protein
VASVYVDLAVARLRGQASSPRLFALRCFGDAFLIIAEALGPLLLVSRFCTIAGWSGPEVVMLIGLARAGEGIALAVGRGLEATTFSETVRLGRFDQVLTRPISPLGWLMTAEVDLRHLFRGFAGIGLVIWAAARQHVPFTLANVAILTVSGLAAAVFVLAVLVMGAALTFRTIEGSEIANLASNGGIGLVGFPLDLYDGALRFVFTFLLPIGICVYVPVLVVLGRDGPAWWLGPQLLPLLPVATAALVGAALLCWSAGLRRYKSTGS